MTSKTKAEIKAFFETGDRPTQSQFEDFVDSYVDRSGPVGSIEAAASGGTNGFAFCSSNRGEVIGAVAAREFQGITVYTTALAVAAVAVPVSAYATTAQAVSGLATGVAMDPVLTKNAILALTLTATASTTTFGSLKYATTAQVVTGTEAEAVTTPSVLSTTKSFAANGYYTLPGGFTIQWGKYTGGADSGTITFPVAFAAACYSVTTGQTSGNNDVQAGITSISTTSFNFNHVGSTTEDFYWIAVGN